MDTMFHHCAERVLADDVPSTRRGRYVHEDGWNGSNCIFELFREECRLAGINPDGEAFAILNQACEDEAAQRGKLAWGWLGQAWRPDWPSAARHATDVELAACFERAARLAAGGRNL